MKTHKEFENAIKQLTPFQIRVLETIERAPNQMANSWEICWNGFAKEWNAKRSVHGAMFRSVLQACRKMQAKGIITILAPRDEHSAHTFSSNRKWLSSR